MTKVDKYLIDIKELPPYKTGNQLAENEKEEEKRTENRHKERSYNSASKGAKGMNSNDQKGDPSHERAVMLSDDKPEEDNKPAFSLRDIILGVINTVSLVLLFVILLKLPKRAKELQNLRIEKLQNESNLSFEFIEVEEYKKKKEELSDLFVDESGVVDFINEVEKLKTGQGVVKKVSFASQEVVKDGTGNYGTPVVIEAVGTWEQVDKTIQDIADLNFIFRPVNTKISINESEGVVVLKYGGFLYVNDKLGKNR